MAVAEDLQLSHQGVPPLSSRSKGKYALFFCLKPEFTQKNLRYLKGCEVNALKVSLPSGSPERYKRTTGPPSQPRKASPTGEEWRREESPPFANTKNTKAKAT